MTVAKLNLTVAAMGESALTIKECLQDAGATGEEAWATTLLMLGTLMEKKVFTATPSPSTRSGGGQARGDTGPEPPQPEDPAQFWHTHLTKLAGPWARLVSPMVNGAGTDSISPGKWGKMVKAHGQWEKELEEYLPRGAATLALMGRQVLEAVGHSPPPVQPPASATPTPRPNQEGASRGTGPLNESLTRGLLLAGVSEHLLDPRARKKAGAFYTPLPVALLVALKTIRPLLPIPHGEQTGPYEGTGHQPSPTRIQVLDPGAGSGLFLMAAVMAFELGLPVNQTGGEKPPLHVCLNGVELTPVARGAAHGALHFALGTNHQTNTMAPGRSHRFSFTMKQGNSLRGTPHLLGSPPTEPPSRAVSRTLTTIGGMQGAGAPPFHWQNQFPQAMTGSPLPGNGARGRSGEADGAGGGFHFIVGNPPYGKFPSSLQNQPGSGVWWPSSSFWDGITGLIGSQEADRLANAMHTNTFVAFVIRAIQLAAPGGRIGLVLPRTLARVKRYAPLRRAVAALCRVEEIIDLGSATRQVGYEQIALILEKGPPPCGAVTKITSRVLGSGSGAVPCEGVENSEHRGDAQSQPNTRPFGDGPPLMTVLTPQHTGFGSHPVPLGQCARSIRFQTRLSRDPAYCELMDMGDIFRGFIYSVNDPGFSLTPPQELTWGGGPGTGSGPSTGTGRGMGGESGERPNGPAGKPAAPQWSRVLRGCDVGRYRVETGAWYDESLANRPPGPNSVQRKRMKHPRLVFPNIVSSYIRSNGALLEEDVVSLDTVTNLTLLPSVVAKLAEPDGETTLLLALLAILNSRLGTFILKNWIFVVSRITCHLDRSYLGRFPIPLSLLKDSTARELLARQAAFLQETNHASPHGVPGKIGESTAPAANESRRREVEALIDRVTFELYNLSNREKELVETIPLFPHHPRLRQ